MNIKLLGIISLDVLIAISPLFIKIAPDLFYWINTFMVFTTLITVLFLLLSKSDSKSLIKMTKEHQGERPSWWNYYDFSSDIFIIYMWTSYEFYSFPFLLIVSKATIAFKMPKYFDLKKG